ncbi:hypothetical protein C8N46_110111 [Kordia periserrulae]|uniref:Uncharacterized protein n=1 Tax=Kordia periserrulae TaxID=701523 RepID=A0A2T6BT88_9FLAO|nr:hypothetical protein C8N46_110111 [Kordia periserrulae]
MVSEIFNEKPLLHCGKEEATLDDLKIIYITKMKRKKFILVA